MHDRVSKVINIYAASIGVDRSLISYCRTKMDLDTVLYPQNGLPPLGVTYNNVSNKKELETIIEIREAFETNYVKLCLANARSTLDRAAGNSVGTPTANPSTQFDTPAPVTPAPR